VLSIGLAYGWKHHFRLCGLFISFGQIAFSFGVGAYATGLLGRRFAWYWMPAALVGGVAACALAIPLGYVMLRLAGRLFARNVRGGADGPGIVTAIPATGSGSGLFLPPGSGITGVYYWTLAVCLGAIALTMWIELGQLRSACGCARCARTNRWPRRSGSRRRRAKITAFGLSR